MPIQIPHESALGIELAKWEQHRTKYVGDEQQPGNPYAFRPYPMMIYRAEVFEGKIVCGLVPPVFATDLDISKATMVTNRCQKIVQSDDQHRLAKGQGWCDSQAEALEACEQQQQAIGNAAAEAAYAAQRMTAKAREEYKMADEATGKHVVDVIPVRKRGRPSNKIAPVIGTGPIEE